MFYKHLNNRKNITRFKSITFNHLFIKLLFQHFFMVNKLIGILLLVCSISTLDAQSKSQILAPGLSTIKEADLKSDLYALADAHFRGRSAGTLDELKASMWIGEKYRKLGLIPMGDDGTYFQFFTMERNVIDEKTTVTLAGQQLSLWKDIAISQMANATINDSVLYLGNPALLDTNTLSVKNKVVAIMASPKDINMDVSLPTWRYSRYIMVKYGNILVRRGAKAIIFVADEMGEFCWDDANENFKRGTYDIEGGPNSKLITTIPVFWVHQKMNSTLMKGALIKANVIIQHYEYPSVNIVGKIEGTDSQLKKEYVLYSGHQDAHGVRNAINGDSIYYGADDNGSVDVAMFAAAKAFKKFPSKRSILFVIQGAEERGLLGSRWHTLHPVVPLQQIVAVLNGDMIGRNNTDSAAILGAQPPHRNSLDLVQIAMDANQEGPKFKLDTTYDKVTHVEGWYFRSDHLPYARLGIPSLMYTSLLHPDYHTPLDNAENINYHKLKKMADWMYLTGWKVANAPIKPAKEANFKLER